jgi:hypothetical protein
MNPATTNIRILPSTPAAIVAGAVGIPVFVLGRSLEATLHGQVAVILWLIVGFFLPLLLAAAARRSFVPNP